MDRSQLADSFYIDDHAMLFAYLLKNAEELCGEEGRAASIKGTIQYGKERGLRMAMRCKADGRPLSPRNYLIYGEWFDGRKWSDAVAGGLKPFVLNYNRCGWSDTWEKYGMEKYGAVYCAWVDQALVAGFNLENKLRIESLKPQGAETCAFCFIGADFDSEDDFQKDGELKVELRSRTVKDFFYHTAHLLSALYRTYLVELGLLKTQNITAKAMAEYTLSFGREKAEALAKEAKQDFLTI